MTLLRLVRIFLSRTMRLGHISLIEARALQQGTRLGIFWVPASTLIFTSMLSLVFHHGPGGSVAQFFLYVLCGHALWQFIQSTINNSTDVIQKKFEFAIHNNMSMPTLFLKLLMDRLFEYSMNLILLAACIVILHPDFLGWQLFLFFPFFLSSIITSIALSYIVNIVTVFAPDFGALVRTGTRFLFFASPVFWIATGDGGVRDVLVLYNPVSHFLSVSRQSFGIEELQVTSWIVVVGTATGLAFVAGLLYRRTNSLVRNIVP